MGTSPIVSLLHVALLVIIYGLDYHYLYFVLPSLCDIQFLVLEVYCVFCVEASLSQPLCFLIVYGWCYSWCIGADPVHNPSFGLCFLPYDWLCGLSITVGNFYWYSVSKAWFLFKC